ncbi:MAG: 4-hydroxy-tetrahydrodipicolinate reductase [Alphaproteobacteria bacterium]
MADFGIGVVGAAGRMGRMLVAEIAGCEGAVLSGAGESAGNPALGQDAGELAGIGKLGVLLGDDASALFAASDAVIDFTGPEASIALAGLAADSGTAHIIGTTGFEPAQQDAIAAAAARTAIVQAPNMSLGVNLLFALTERVAGALGEDFDIEIFEIHHRHKVDAPSGTALGLGQAAAKGRGVDLEAVSERGRDGITGARKRGAIGFASLRGGDVVGDHTVTFAGEGERIELTHRAGSRRIYAAGAVRAALWSQGKPPGLYGMKDVLGI